MHLEPAGLESADEAAQHVDWRKRARSLKGALIHIAHVHPAICNATSRVCAHMATPTRASYAAAKRILAWLSHRADVGVTFGHVSIDGVRGLRSPKANILPMDPAERDYSLHCMVDSDLPSGVIMPRDADDAAPINKASHRAQLGYVIMLGGGCIEAVSRRQHSTAVDVAAAELFAASTAAAVLLLINNVLRFLSFHELGDQPVRIWCDNEAAVLVSKDATSIKRLAYIARRCRFLQELTERGDIRLLNVPGTANPADALTKHVSPKSTFRSYMARIYQGTADQF